MGLHFLYLFRFFEFLDSILIGLSDLESMFLDKLT